MQAPFFNRAVKVKIYHVTLYVYLHPQPLMAKLTTDRIIFATLHVNADARYLMY